MKKFLLVVAIAGMACFGAYAQRYTEKHIGIMGGLTSSKTSIKDVDEESLALYHIGVVAQLPLTNNLSLQPGIFYQVKGVSVDKVTDASFQDFETKVGFLEIPVQVQYGFDLALFRPYLLAEPFIGWRLGSSNDGQAKEIKGKLKNAEYGLGVGAGVDFWKLQFSVKYFWNFGHIYKTSEIDDTVSDTVRDAVNHGNNFNGISFSLAFFF